VGDERQYFGRPGHCYDIDGFLWHSPGECRGAAVNCDGKCCGYDEPAGHLAIGATVGEIVVTHRAHCACRHCGFKNAHEATHCAGCGCPMAEPIGAPQEGGRS
jgi:hypothetical protein